MNNRFFLLDTTLRDGEQSPGATMNLQEKLRLASQLETLGVDCVEAGFPASSGGDFVAVKAIAETLSKCEVTALSRCHIPDIDRAWDALKKAVKPRLHVFIATSALHMEYKLRKSPQEVLDMVAHSVAHAASLCPNVEFSAEDATRSDPNFLAQVFSTAIYSGAKIINIADTVGYAMPQDFARLLRFILGGIPKCSDGGDALLSVHCHNDLGLGVANTLAALEAGARQVEVTLSGIGERAGNAALEEVVMALKLRKDVLGLDCNIVTEQIFPSCRLLSMITGQPIAVNKPIIGGNAFAHESGIHQDGVLKNPATYEIMLPQSIGRKSSDLVIGKHSGRHAVRTRLNDLGYKLNEDQFNHVFDAVKKLAEKKKNLHDEDLEALIMTEVYRIPDKFKLISISVQSSTPSLPATAAVALEVEGQVVRHAGFGVGTIDAAFNVIAHLMGRDVHLENYTVNAITGGTDALGEVTVRLESSGITSVGRGSDPDIILASALAYVDAMNRIAQKEKDLKQ